MNLMRQHRKLFAVFFMAAFLSAFIEIHADHDGAEVQKTRHCCVQCCPSHNLAPTIRMTTSVDSTPFLHGLHIVDDSPHVRDIADSIFRPPISLS